MAQLVLLAILICSPVCIAKHIGHAAKSAFYATTNFVVNHLQPNQKGEKGKVARCNEPGGCYIYFGEVGPANVTYRNYPASKLGDPCPNGYRVVNPPIKKGDPVQIVDVGCHIYKMDGTKWDCLTDPCKAID